MTPSPFEPPKTEPKISVVIPAFNARDTIEECLDHIFRSELKAFETIVVDDGSTDDTLAKVSRYPCQVFKGELNQGAARARNLGADAGRAELILFIDSDVLIPPNLLGRVWNFFISHPEVAILQGSYDHEPYYRNLLSQYKHYIFSFRGFKPGGTYIHYVHTACVAVRKEVLRKIRFDEHLKRREDIEFGLRASRNHYLIYADPSLNVRHKKRYGLMAYSKYQFATVKELILQHWVMKNKNFAEEFRSGKEPFYKKAWLLRPVLCFLLLVSLTLVAGTKSFLGLSFLILILILSFLLEFPFRLYLFRRAPISVSLGAWFLYFYDGLLIGLGAAAGLMQALGTTVCELSLTQDGTNRE